jgi:hypothetical protein
MYSFWYGKISLWKSYWLVGELLNALILLLIFNIEIYFFKNSNLVQSLPFLHFNSFNILSKILFISWTIYITVGIWRSAENYKGNFIWIVLTLIILSYRLFTLRLVLFS